MNFVKVTIGTERREAWINLDQVLSVRPRTSQEGANIAFSNGETMTVWESPVQILTDPKLKP